MTFAHACLRELAEIVAPQRCFLCGSAASADGVACERHLPGWPGAGPGLEGARCGHCLAALGAGLPDGAPCAFCRRRPSPLAGGLALGPWRRRASGDDALGEGGLAPWILALKHGRRRELARPLGAALGAALAQRRRAALPQRPAVLVPIPLHPLRRLERGFDQAAELARHAARAAGLPWVQALERARPTAPQGSAFGRERGRNVRGAFVPRAALWPWTASPASRLRGADVWLVDDVASSAATASEAARVCRAMGADRVLLLLLARGSP